jgi:hypothetical protein
MPPAVERHARLLRAWHLAMLRFALTRENADRLAVFAIANEIDRLGKPPHGSSGFSFFREASTRLCTAALRRQQDDVAVLEGYLAQIDDRRLSRTLAEALEMPKPKPNAARKRRRAGRDLWSGLPSRTNALP